MKKTLIIALIVAVVAGAAGFFGGMYYQRSRRLTFRGQIPGGGQFFQSGDQRRQGSSGVRPVAGEITAIDSGTLTVKSPDDSSHLVVYSASTSINKTASASAQDLKVGDKVTAVGTTGSGNTLTAQSISLGDGLFASFRAPANPTP